MSCPFLSSSFFAIGVETEHPCMLVQSNLAGYFQSRSERAECPRGHVIPWEEQEWKKRFIQWSFYIAEIINEASGFVHLAYLWLEC